MNLEDYKFESYLYVIKELDIDPRKDIISTYILDEILRAKPVKRAEEAVRSLLKGRKAVVVGAGPYVMHDLKRAHENGLLNGSVILAADGASLAFQSFTGQVPHIIVTDLDGFPEEEVKMVNQGSIPVVHAHGDNVDKVVGYVPKMAWALGTTQTFETQLVKNYGGFTDGDRACYIACAFDAAEIYLLGMDFSNIVGEYSNLNKFVGSFDRKRKKLLIGIRMLEALARRCNAQIVNASFNATIIDGIKNL
ncbi:MAG: 6-hydroxymethylpterin diphosphokinase MptE-like protein [Nitrososphaeria archaeon]